MNARIILFLVVTLLFTTKFSYADFPNARVDATRLHPIITGDEPLPHWSSFPNNAENPPPPAVDTIGNVYRAGRTWYDLQYVGSGGRMIQYVPTMQWTHVAWNCGFDSGASTLHVKYNYFDASTQQWMIWGTGVQVPPATVARSAFTTLGMINGIAFPALHESNPRANVQTGNVYHDIEQGVGAFISDNPLPLLIENGTTVPTNWPHIAIGRNNAVHLVTTEGGVTSSAGMRQWYHRGVYSPVYATITWGQPQQLPGTTLNVAAEVAASRISNRAAVAWMRPVEMDRNPPLGEYTQWNNNVVVVTSLDGINWGFNDFQYVTHWRLPNPDLYPDTLAACRDTFRAFNDVNLMFDSNDILHAVFTTHLYYALPEPRIYSYGHIWHWRSDEPETLSMVADGGNRNVELLGSPGSWDRTVQNGTLSQGTNGYLYCTFTGCYDPRNPVTTTSDISLAGIPNYDIYVSVSTDGGRRWSAATNITDTHTPNAVAGQCLSERFPSSNQTADNYVQISYLTDFDAGSAVLNEGSWTNNDFNYHRVPLVSIPTTPLLPEYNIFMGDTVLVLLHPSGGNHFYIGYCDTIRWSQSWSSGTVQFQLNRHYPSDIWETIEASQVSLRACSWVVYGDTTSTARVRIRLNQNLLIGDTSDANFSIAPRPTITLLSPNGGEQLIQGRRDTIRWSCSSVVDGVQIQMKQDYPNGPWIGINTSPLSTTSRLWQVSQHASTSVRIRILSLMDTTVGDTSDANFTIIDPRVLHVVSPNGGEEWQRHHNQTIRFVRTTSPGHVAVYLNHTYPTETWEFLGSTLNDSIQYYCLSLPTQMARIKIRLASDTTIFDVSDTSFSIVDHRALQIINPNGGENWQQFSDQTIRFARTDCLGDVSVYLNRTYPTDTWTFIGYATGDSLQYNCIASPTNAARVRVRLTSDSTIFDESDSNFTIFTDGVTGNGNELPKEFRLTGVFPNPFNAATDIRYDLPIATPVTIELFDARGRFVQTLYQGYVNAGSHHLSWRATEQPSGVYFVRISALNRAFVAKAVLLR